MKVPPREWRVGKVRLLTLLIMSQNFKEWVSRASVARVITLLILSSLMTVWANNQVDSVNYKPLKDGKSTVEERRVADKFQAQSDGVEGWALALLGLLTAVVVTTRVHKAPQIETLFIILGPAFIALLFSVRASRALHMRLTNLYAFNNLEDIASVEDMLIHQWDLFFIALICVAIFAGSYLVNIVRGAVKPYDPKGDA